MGFLCVMQSICIVLIWLFLYYFVGFMSTQRLSYETTRQQRAFVWISSLRAQYDRSSHANNALHATSCSATVVRMSAQISVHHRASSTSRKTKWKFIPLRLTNVFKIVVAISSSTTSPSDSTFCSTHEHRKSKSLSCTPITRDIMCLTFIIVASSSWSWTKTSELECNSTGFFLCFSHYR